MRRLGERHISGQEYQRRPGAYAIIRNGSKALLTASIAEAQPEVQLAGGGIDVRENPVHALHREVMEETGWRIAVERRLGVYQRYCFMPDYDKWAQKICTIYLARPVMKLSEPTEEHHLPIWTDLELLPELLSDSTQSEFVTDHLGLIW